MNPDKYPEFMESYLGSIMPQIGEWATASGVYNPAAVSRKASENLFPYLMSLGQQGAGGIAGMPFPQLGEHWRALYTRQKQKVGWEKLEKWLPFLGGMAMGGLGGGAGGAAGAAGGGAAMGAGEPRRMF